ncbi:tRNA lysidine(34) synthetase TilS [Novosphingobium sp.]|uniref:tRNA lysidine(34) synthetase TilS n=1 Tax=Novosphingobium sp. TaxID=1874826 RepID=UPI0026155880|nr:tRNA lysidine(34) synthetase TilS [Novosphingobium sp.]
MLEARFAADWLAIWPEKTAAGLAVSGGPDSLALLLLARAAIPGALRVATVDHGLRPESAAEALYVAKLCADLGIPHEILTIALPSGPAVQERARVARYAALGDWAVRSGLAAIATAHHADDQAETLFMRLARGAGVRGLAAMRGISPLPGRPDCQLLRPLLGWRRSDLAKIVAAAGIEPVLDPSNRDHRFERVRMRTMLSGLGDIDPLSIAASARHLAEADAAIDWAAEQCFGAVRTSGGVSYWDPRGVPRAVAQRVLERILIEVGTSKPRGNALARWHDRLAAGEIATLAGVRGDGRMAEWRFVVAPRPRSVAASPSGSP